MSSLIASSICILILSYLSYTSCASGDDELNILELYNCPYQVEPIGCVKDEYGFDPNGDNKRALPHELLNSRDIFSLAYKPPSIQWGNYNHWLANFICECAKSLFAQKDVSSDYVGVQFYGECWANLNKHQRTQHDRYKTSDHCIHSDYKSIAAGESPKKCGLYAGKGLANFIYKVSKYHRACPEMIGDYNSKHGSIEIAINDITITGEWVDGYRPKFSGQITNGCKGLLTFKDDKKYEVEYDTNTCELSLKEGYSFTKKECKKSIQCPHFTSRGCWNDPFPRQEPSKRPMNFYEMNERDPRASNFNHRFIEWGKWGQGYLIGLLCRCAKLAKQTHKKFFSIQFYGECWTGNKDDFNKYGAVTRCIDSKFETCPMDDKMCRPNPCAGEWEANKVYEIEEELYQCATNPCENGGHCVTHGPDHYKCHCEQNYHGTHCEERHDI